MPAIITFAVAEVLFESHSSRGEQLEILAAAPIIVAGLYLGALDAIFNWIVQRVL